MSTCKIPLSIGRIGGVGGAHERGREGEAPSRALEARPMAEQGAFGGMQSFSRTQREQPGDSQKPTAPKFGNGQPPSMKGPRLVGALPPAPGGLLSHHDAHAIREALEVVKTMHQIARDAAKAL